MKYFILLIAIIISFSVSAQFVKKIEGSTIIDIAQMQLNFLSRYKTDSLKMSTTLIDSMYIPHREFMYGYMGIKDEKDFKQWIDEDNIPKLDLFKKRNAEIDGARLLMLFEQAVKRMTWLTGHRPTGKWYIIFGPGWTDLGGLSSGEMIIDLSHEANISSNTIMKSFPHELTHQIMNNVNTNTDTTAINTIISEGFAVYVNQLYWGKKYTAAQNLGYTKDEFTACNKNEKEINIFFEKNKFSPDKKIIEQFRLRSWRLQPNLPGAIGYYIGYRIIAQYVKKYGKNSWKDVFIKSAREIYELSGY